MARRTKIRRRKRIFVGCEGESEQGYVALLQRFADERQAAVHAETKVVPGGSNPLNLVKRAIVLAALGERGSKPAYTERFLLMDTDQFGQDPNSDAQIPGLIARHNFVLLKQNCCFEAFLLRHIEGHDNDDPPNAELALSRIKNFWPEYKKGLPALELRKRITLTDVQRAAQNPRNVDFIAFINSLGLSPN